MPGFDLIIDQHRPVKILTSLLQNGTIPHALLFTGPEGVGKKTAAMFFAMACNCTLRNSGQFVESGTDDHKNESNAGCRNSSDVPCGICNACRRIESGIHPDIIRLKPSGPIIKIAQIRELGHSLTMKPFEAGMRVIIIEDAQTMNPSAGNALLKMLEEPPARTILILVATQKTDLLPTIVSRCQHIRFNPISRKNLEALLVANHDFSTQDALVAACMANGSVTHALRANRGTWRNRREWLINEINMLPTMPLRQVLAVAENLSRSKDDLPQIFDIINTWLRDLIIWKYNPQKIINRDLEQKIGDTSLEMGLTSLINKVSAIQAARAGLHTSANVRLSLEKLLLELARN